LYEPYLQNKLQGKKGIIESSSGNTALSLTVIGRALGIKETKVLVSDSVPLDKLQLLQFFGSKVQINNEPLCPDKDDPESGINIAKRMASEQNWFNPGQYDNEDNPNAHYKWTGNQIWEQTEGNVSVVSATLGTTGTISGVGKFLKEKNKKVCIVGAASASDIDRLGARTVDLLMEVGFDWKKYVDNVQEVNPEDSLLISLKLCRVGLMAGPSSGFNLIGLYNWIGERIKDNTIDNYRNKNNEIVCVFISPDGPLPYINTYLKKLDKSYFPEIENIELINNPRKKLEEIANKKSFSQFERNVNEVEEILFNGEKKELENGIGFDKNYIAIDIRKNSDFDKFRIAGILHIPFDEITNLDEEQIKKFKKYKLLIFNCGFSPGSKLAVAYLQSKKIDSYYVKGGMDIWAKEKLPYERIS
jgi:cysteine synthase/rhodanese-related sulfurtransferase